MSFFEYRSDDRLYLKSSLFEDSGISHGFSSSLGGVSRGKINGFNLGFRVGDDKSSVMENYRLLSLDLDADLNKMVLAKQTHTDNIRIVTEDDLGKGISKISDIEDTDGLICNIPDTMLIVFAADCVPVLLYDKVNHAIGAVHSGWRGSVKGICQKAVCLMQKTYDCDPRNIVAAIGPSIGPCCFEVDEDTAIYFDDKYKIKKSNEKFNINLWQYNKDKLTESGVLSKNIDISRVCTICNSDRFYSYRTHRNQTGRQVAAIMLRG